MKMRSFKFTISFIVMLTVCFNFGLSQYDYHTMFYSGFKNSSDSVIAVSPLNGDIIIAGNADLLLYDSQGNFKLDIRLPTNTSKFIHLYWTSDYLISIHDNGVINKYDPKQLYYLYSTNASAGVRSTCVSKNNLALMYYSRIQQFSLPGLASTFNYTNDEFYYYDIAYSNAQQGQYLFALTNTYYIFIYNRGNNFANLLQVHNSFGIFNVHPSLDNIVLSDSNGYLFELDLTINGGYKISNYKDFKSYARVGYAIYSQSGDYLINLYQNKNETYSYISNISIWNNNLNIVQDFYNITVCTIIDIKESNGVLALFDKCGFVAILYVSRSYGWIAAVVIIPILIIIAIVVFIKRAVIVPKVQGLFQKIGKKKNQNPLEQDFAPHKNQSSNQGQYSNQDTQHEKPNW